MTRSLRTRLLIGLTVGTSVVLIASGLVLYNLIRAELLAEFDESLISEARSIATLVEEKDGLIQTEMGEHGVPVFETEDRPVYYALWRSDGTLIERSSVLGSTELAQFGGTPGQPEFRRVMLPNQQAGRMVGIHFTPHKEDEDGGREPTNGARNDEQNQVTLVVARGTSGLETTLTRIGLLLVGVFGSAVLILVLVAAPIVRVSLHPLERISEQIQSLDIDSLAERLDSTHAPNEVSAVINCLNELLDRLHDSFQRERAFSANVAHEFRTPLAGLRSTIDVALAKPIDLSSDRRSLQRCLAICKQAESLTENLLALARFDANQCRVHQETIGLKELLHTAWSPLASRAESRELAVSWAVDEQLKISTDSSLLSLILRNLLDNTVSYTDLGGSIAINACVEHGVAKIDICNSADKLPHDLVDRAFDRFWRADAARSGTGAHAGLGLPLCHEATRVLGGVLTLSARNDEFCAELRLRQDDG